MQLKIPESLKREHEELHTELKNAIKSGGKVGDAARAVADVLHAHFVKEEAYALPPLGLLSTLADGVVTPEMRDVLVMTNKLKSDLPHMLEEHKAIISSLENLADVSKKENKLEYAAFAERLMLHAKNEEEVLYPAALLIGEYLKQRLER